jgi:hypothetical protein
MSTLRSYKINRAQLILEDFGDETVIVHVPSGFYYSVSGSGPKILELIEAGVSDSDLPSMVLGKRAPRPDADAEIRVFVDRLLEEGIIVERLPEDAVQPFVTTADTSEEDALALASPVLERFDEVRDLLLIDPVHQVDENYGWPKAR